MTESADSSAREDARQKMIDRANTDPAFRARLLENPREAISELLGIDLPESMAVRAIEEQPGEVVLVLPARRTGSGTRLSAEDLAQVAGGNSLCSGSWYHWTNC